MGRCEWPELFEADWNGLKIVYMTAEEFPKQRACQVVANTNYAVAQANAESVDEVVAAFNDLVDKAELHNGYAQNELDREHGKLVEEKFENFVYKSLLALTLIAVAL